MGKFRFPTVRTIKVTTPQSLFFSGFNPDVDLASTPEDIWPLGGLIAFAATAGPVSVVSTSPNDAAPTGAGAQSLLLRGVDDAFVEISEVVALDGTTPVLTTADFLHVQSAGVIAAGSGASNAGLITFTIDGGVVNGIAIGKSQTQSCARVIPVSVVPDTTAHLLNVFALAGRQLSVLATVTLVITPVSGVITETLDIPLTSAGGPFNLDFYVPIDFAAGTRLVARVTDVSAVDVLVTAGLQFCWLDPSDAADS